VRAKIGADVGSNHHLVVGMVKLKLKRHARNTNKLGMRFNVDMLLDLKSRQNCDIELTNRFDILSSLVEECKINTIPILMHQMRISTNQVSSVVLRPKKLKSEKL
jgi:hypothetical protein